MLKELLKDYRKKNCLSMKDMCSILEVTYPTYWEWEHGTIPNPHNARKIADKLGFKKEEIYD